MLKRFDFCSEAFQLLGSFQVACILWEFFGLAPPPFSGALHIIAIDQNRSGSLTSFAFVLLIIISGATTTVPFDLARASDCLAVPNSPAPKGSHWHYHLNRTTQQNPALVSLSARLGAQKYRSTQCGNWHRHFAVRRFELVGYQIGG